MLLQCGALYREWRSLKADWKTVAFGFSSRLERSWDRRRRRMRERLGWIAPATIVPFRGYGDATRVRVAGRVLEVGGLGKPQPDDGTWRTLRHMFHRFESDEVPDAQVRGRCRGEAVETLSDGEGYFEMEFSTADAGTAPQQRWQQVDLELLAPLRKGQERVKVAAPVLVPPASASFGVISDIDDTILRTGATDLFRNLRTTLLNTAESRSPFAGVSAFYRALAYGRAGAPSNPIFYVSSSPWNLYDVLEVFILHHGIPEGPFFLRDLGFDPDKLLSGRHQKHKSAAIERLLEFYPDLQFILIGDSGQKDPEIYRDVVRRHPHRVLAVYIRDLTPHRHNDAAHRLLDEIRSHGIVAVAGPDLIEAAEQAAGAGWIEAGTVEGVRGEVAAQQGRPA